MIKNIFDKKEKGRENMFFVHEENNFSSRIPLGVEEDLLGIIENTSTFS